jgi:RTX toxins and related Ca2+-binding proteins
LKGGTGSDTFRFLGGSITARSMAAGDNRRACSAIQVLNPAYRTGLPLQPRVAAALRRFPATRLIPRPYHLPYSSHRRRLVRVVAERRQRRLQYAVTLFHVQAGDKVSGWAFFDTTDKTANNDDGYVVIKQGSTIVATLFAASVSSVGSFNHTPWTRWEFGFSTAGTYTVEAGVRNAKNNLLPSFIGLDAVALSSLDTLDYSAASAALVVNLALGSATSTGGVLNIQNVIGGAGNDILVGNALDNVLIGGGGADILIGGLGRDYVYGGTGE